MYSWYRVVPSPYSVPLYLFHSEYLLKVSEVRLSLAWIGKGKKAFAAGLVKNGMKRGQRSGAWSAWHKVWLYFISSVKKPLHLIHREILWSDSHLTFLPFPSIKSYMFYLAYITYFMVPYIMHKNLWNIFYLLNFHTTLYLPLLRPLHLFYLLACKWDGRKRRKGGSKFMEAFLNKSLAHKCSFQDLPLRRRRKAAFHGGQWWLQV